jgi:hypothetical protein
MNTNNIGKILHFNEADYSHNIRQLEGKIIPQLNSIREKYKDLSIGEFNQSVYEDITAHGLKNIKEKFLEIIRKDFKGFKSPAAAKAAMESATELLSPLAHSITELFNTHSQITKGISDNLMPWSDLKFINGEFTIDKEAIKNRSELRVENEAQNELYNLLIDAQGSLNNLCDFVKKYGFDPYRHTFIGPNGFLFEETDCHFEVNLGSVHFV